MSVSPSRILFFDGRCVLVWLLYIITSAGLHIKLSVRQLTSNATASSHVQSWFYLERGSDMLTSYIILYHLRTRVGIWAISTVTAPNKHMSCKSCSSRTRPSVTATAIVCAYYTARYYFDILVSRYAVCGDVIVKLIGMHIGVCPFYQHTCIWPGHSDPRCVIYMSRWSTCQCSCVCIGNVTMLLPIYSYLVSWYYYLATVG